MTPTPIAGIRTIQELRDCDSGTAHTVSLSAELRTVPREILEHAPNVKVLDLSHNQLDSLPDWLSELRSLEVIFLSNNRFREVPRVLGSLRSLRMLGMRACRLEHIPREALPSSLIWLTLTDNYLRSLPPEIGSLERLRKVLLAGNQLSDLPESFANLSSLELLRLSANRFERFPAWLLRLPNLAWLAIAGNPCSATDEVRREPTTTIPWSQLTLSSELGRGASGPTYCAVYTPPDGPPYEVAVKVFHSPVSSDGDWRDEIAAAVRAGRHPCLTSTIAPFSEHPEERNGLVLELVPNTFTSLARPPSFESCTRDVYASNEYLSFPVALAYASQIAQAASYLHAREIVHGDLYAHNILVDGSRALLGDFGAACVYQGHDALDGRALEQIEVRAIGILLEALLMVVATTDQATYARAITELARLAQDCLDKKVSTRPSCQRLADDLTNLVRLTERA